jgi:DNA-binding IscR family transcriptional regulator
MVLDSPIPSVWNISAPASADARLAEAMATLVHGTGDRRVVISVAEVLAVSLAAGGLVRRVEGTSATRLPRTPGEVTTHDAWIAVDAALTPFNDGSRRRHTQAPVRVHAALAIYRAALDDRTTGAALADAVQYLPTVADNLRRSVLGWPTTAAVFADAHRLPARDGRGPVLAGGDRFDRMVRVDAVDLIPVHNALVSTRVLSSALADRVGHHQALRAHRSWSAHHEQQRSRDGLSRVSDAQAQAFVQLHSLAAPRRPARSR